MAQPKFRLDDPGELIAAVPAILGFYPADSLVVVTFGPSPQREKALKLGIVARTDLEQARASLADTATEICRICAADTAAVTAVVMVLVDSAAPDPSTDDRTPWQRDQRGLMDHVANALAAAGIRLEHTLAVKAIEADATWWDLVDPDRNGQVLDPDASPIACTNALHGGSIRRSRADLEALVRHDPAAVEAVRRALGEAARDANVSEEEHAPQCGRDRLPGTAVVTACMAEVAAGRTPGPADLARCARALREETVRNYFLAVAVTEDAAAAQQLWGVLARTLPDPDRAHAAFLLGCSAYVGGDGVLAVIAFAAALESDPGHQLAAGLDAALRTGLDPHEVRQMLRQHADRLTAAPGEGSGARRDADRAHRRKVAHKRR
ncbi:DUF4192 domain-containing protein [Nocardia sp. NPDC003482]